MELHDLRKATAPIFKQYGIISASVFGSVARGTASPESDVDLLVRLGQPMGLIRYSQLIGALTSALGRDVDLVTEGSLNEHLKPFIEPELETVYED